MSDLKFQPRPPTPERVVEASKDPHRLGDVIDVLSCLLVTRDACCWVSRDRVDDSTIKVRGAKTKFGQVRIYVDLAADERVRELWRERGGLGDPDEDFIKKRIVHDSAWYRRAYMIVLKLFPEFWTNFYDGADYSGLLAETREGLDELLDSEYYSGVPKELEDDREVLYRICGFIR